MKLLANENFPVAAIKYLSDNGFDVKAIGIDNMSVSDKQVMAIAVEEERIILTFDRDYGELIFKYFYKPDMGVIYLRLDQYQPEEPGIIIANLLGDPSFESSRKLTVVSAEGIRQRSY